MDVKIINIFNRTAEVVIPRFIPKIIFYPPLFATPTLRNLSEQYIYLLVAILQSVVNYFPPDTDYNKSATCLNSFFSYIYFNCEKRQKINKKTKKDIN